MAFQRLRTPNSKPAIRAQSVLGAGVFDQRCGRTGKAFLTPASSAYTPIMKQEPLNLPKPVAAYFRAEKAGAESVCQCFTENAVVKDEDTPPRPDAIKQWRTRPQRSLNSRASLSRVKEGWKNSRHQQAHRDFSGSRLTFDSSSIQGEKIESLEIIP
jgi:hypothetical protein